MLVLSLVLMGISTTAVGFLPTAAMIGAAARYCSCCVASFRDSRRAPSTAVQW